MRPSIALPAIILFLRARVAEDEQAAVAALTAAEPSSSVSVYWSPRRALAECTAKRALLDRHERYDEYRNDCMEDGYSMPCHSLKALALAYADHTDYQTSWA